MSSLIFVGGGELDPNTSAGRALADCKKVAVITLAAAFRRPDVIQSDIRVWAEELAIEYVLVEVVRRADCLNPANSDLIADADGILILDGSSAHLVSGLKNTPLLEAVVGAHSRGVKVAWSGAAASAVCDPMVDDRGGALTVGLRLYHNVAVATMWDRWPVPRRHRLCRMLPDSVLFMALNFGAAVSTQNSLYSQCSLYSLHSVLSNSSDSHHSSHNSDSHNKPKEVNSNNLKSNPSKLISDSAEWAILGGNVEAQQFGKAIVLRAA